MKKIAYLLAAIPAALFSKATVADISVSESGSLAYVDEVTLHQLTVVFL